MPSIRECDSTLLGGLFAANGQLVSRQELGRLTGISPAAIERRLAPYVHAGYPIAFHPQGGISLRDPPDIWCAEEIMGRCLPQKKSSAPAWNPLLLAETSSTNDVAREQARKGAKSGFVVAASRQTAGRGRMGRNWESPPDRGLYVSILLKPDFR